MFTRTKCIRRVFSVNTVDDMWQIPLAMTELVDRSKAKGKNTRKPAHSFRQHQEDINNRSTHYRQR